jgi:hypothetical protein
MSSAAKAADVKVGDEIRVRDMELKVTRIDQRFFGRDTMVAFVEDTDRQWIKVPAELDSDVEVL